MATNRPDPGDFLELAQQLVRQLFGEPRTDDEPWEEATRRPRADPTGTSGTRELGADRRREDLAFALATRAVEALEDVALNVAAIRQRLERTGTPAAGGRPDGQQGSAGSDAAGP